uniref:Putative gamma-glutamylcyclotransferase n=1 Tax=Moniliophthora roreri TaxID=221103 RepID=A0A0W0FX60_MONRR
MQSSQLKYRERENAMAWRAIAASSRGFENLLPSSTFRPRLMFFYGTLTLEHLRKRLLGTDARGDPPGGPPKDATIRGWSVKMWGPYPALVESESKEDSVVHGKVWLVLDEEQLQRIQRYDGKQYRMAAVDVYVEGSSTPETGYTMVWNSDFGVLRDGSFDPSAFYFRQPQGSGEKDESHAEGERPAQSFDPKLFFFYDTYELNHVLKQVLGTEDPTPTLRDAWIQGYIFKMWGRSPALVKSEPYDKDLVIYGKAWNVTEERIWNELEHYKGEKYKVKIVSVLLGKNTFPEVGYTFVWNGDTDELNRAPANSNGNNGNGSGKSMTSSSPGPSAKLDRASPSRTPSTFSPRLLFFYGALSLDYILQRVVGLKDSPAMRPATIRGYWPKMWNDTPALVQAAADVITHGKVWTVSSEEHMQRITREVGETYRLQSIDVTLDDGKVTNPGFTFVWNGKPEILKDGSFDSSKFP